MMISVILPVRNGDIKLIKQAVDSVLAQTYSNLELLLVDDGSERDFAKELDGIAGADKRIRIFHIEPSGVSAARNYAIKEAKGDIITFIDGDDTIAPGCFDEADRILRDSEIDALFGGTLYVETTDGEVAKSAGMKTDSTASGQTASDDPVSDEHTQRKNTDDKPSIRVLKLTEERLHKSRAEVIGEPFRFENGGYINRGIAARFIRKEVFDDERFLFPVGIRMYEDAIWNLRMIDSLRIAYVKRIWYYYYENPASASNKYNPDVVDVMEKPLEIMQGILDLRNPVEYRAYTRLLMDSLRYIYMCMLGNPKWKKEFKSSKNVGGNASDLTSETYASAKRKVKKHIYHDAPWKEIGSGRFRKYSEKRDRQKALLYKMHLLLIYWKLTWKR